MRSVSTTLTEAFAKAGIGSKTRFRFKHDSPNCGARLGIFELGAREENVLLIAVASEKRGGRSVAGNQLEADHPKRALFACGGCGAEIIIRHDRLLPFILRAIDAGALANGSFQVWVG